MLRRRRIKGLAPARAGTRACAASPRWTGAGAAAAPALPAASSLPHPSSCSSSTGTQACLCPLIQCSLWHFWEQYSTCGGRAHAWVLSTAASGCVMVGAPGAPESTLRPFGLWASFSLLDTTSVAPVCQLTLRHRLHRRRCAQVKSQKVRRLRGMTIAAALVRALQLSRLPWLLSIQGRQHVAQRSAASSACCASAERTRGTRGHQR